LTLMSLWWQISVTALETCRLERRNWKVIRTLWLQRFHPGLEGPIHPLGLSLFASHFCDGFWISWIHSNVEKSFSRSNFEILTNVGATSRSFIVHIAVVVHDRITLARSTTAAFRSRLGTLVITVCTWWYMTHECANVLRMIRSAWFILYDSLCMLYFRYWCNLVWSCSVLYCHVCGDVSACLRVCLCIYLCV